jgi:type IV pilus assembly protein PilW
MSIESHRRSPGSLRLAPVRCAHGFTLTELLVGMAIGLIGIIAMFQVLTMWDKMQRSTAAGSDAQIAGTVGYFRLERDVKQAGMGFAKSTVLGCDVSALVNATATTTARAAFTFALVPVQIIREAGKPDELQVLYGNSAFFVAEQTFKASTASSKKTSARHGFKVGDAVVVADDAAHCALVEISGDSNADLLTLDHTAGSLRFNAAGGTGTTFTNGVLFNLGPDPQLNRWSVANGALQVTYGLRGNTAAVTVADGVIDLRAKYGIDLNGDNTVDASEWEAPDPDPITPGDWTRLRAVRVAILARSQQYEPTRSEAGAPVYVSPTAPVLPWRGADDAAIPFTMKNIDGSDDDNPQNDNDWRNYRYRVYGGEIFLRNMIWGVSP